MAFQQKLTAHESTETRKWKKKFFVTTNFNEKVTLKWGRVIQSDPGCVGQKSVAIQKRSIHTLPRGNLKFLMKGILI